MEDTGEFSNPISQDLTSESTALVKRGRPRVGSPITTLWELLQRIEHEDRPDGKITLYRGHTSFRHKLRPAIFRDVNSRIRSRENTILRELITKHPNEFSDDANVFENLVRMQHYELPTRLLDLTYNPLVAAYFACDNDNGDHSEIVSITVDLEHFKYYDSDTVHCISSLAYLNQVEHRELRECGDDDALRNSIAGKRLFDFVSQVRPNFSPRINRKDLSNFFVVSPKLNNPRIIAQTGAFLIFGLSEELTKSSGFAIKKYRIDKSSTSSIRRSLEMIGVTEATIYPSLESTARQIIRKYMP